MMDRIRSIVVGVDLSPPSACALKQAIRIARQDGAAVHAVHILDPLAVMDLEQLFGEGSLLTFRPPPREVLLGEVRRRWESFRSQIAGSSDLELDIRFDHHLPAMLDAIRRHSADLVVLGTHSGEAGPDLVAGSLATACVRKAPCEVLLVRDAHAGPFKVVVACVDFSDTSRRALEQAVNVAARDRASLHVLHVYRSPWQVLPIRPSVLEIPAEAQQRHRERLRRELDAYCRPLCQVLSSLQPRYELYEHPRSYGAGISEYLKRVGADLVVLGTRGRTNLRYVLMGSTAERVVRSTACSVLALKPDCLDGPAAPAILGKARSDVDEVDRVARRERLWGRGGVTGPAGPGWPALSKESAMKVKDIMSAPVVTVRADATLVDIATVMLDRYIGGVPVVTSNGRLAGIVTESDFAAEERGVPFSMLRLPQVLGRWLSKDNLASIYESARKLTAADVMATDVVTVTEDESLEEAVRRMCKSKIHRLPVVRGRVPVGMVTRHDLLTAMVRAGAWARPHPPQAPAPAMATR
jgi:universal stress protein E